MRPDDIAPSPLRVIVSGGISSGKSTVVANLRDLGATVVEADRIGHEILEPDGPAAAAVAARWPEVVADGRIDRSRLAAIVFTDGDELAELEAIVHPHIAAEIARRVGAAGENDVVLELPLASDLAGPGWIRIVVDAPDQVRLQRAVERGMDAADARSRMAMQPGRQEWAGLADVFIDNSGTLEALELEVRRVWHKLKHGDA